MKQNISVLGVNVSSSSWQQVLTKLDDVIHQKTFSRSFFVVTVNPEFVMTAQRDNEFKKILNSADLAIADGNGLKLANPTLDIVPGRKLVEELIRRKYKIFYLGGRDGVAAEMKKRFGGESDEGSPDIKSQISNPKSQINLDTKILNKINKYKTDILLVAYGAPWQEKWIAKNLDQLNAKVVMGVGGTFDFLTGGASVAPEWVSGAGFEWLWRLVHEPWRWRRQLVLIEYCWLVVLSRIGHRGRI